MTHKKPIKIVLTQQLNELSEKEKLGQVPENPDIVFS